MILRGVWLRNNAPCRHSHARNTFHDPLRPSRASISQRLLLSLDQKPRSRLKIAVSSSATASMRSGAPSTASCRDRATPRAPGSRPRRTANRAAEGARVVAYRRDRRSAAGRIGGELTGGEATFYVEVTRGAAPRTHQFPATPTTPTVYMTVNGFKPADDLRVRGASAITIPDIRWLRCDIKSIQLLPNVLAKQAAVERGAIDSLMVRDGMVTEGSHANFMGVVGRCHPNAPDESSDPSRESRERWYWRSLPGSVSRRSTRRSPRARIETLDEAFLTGTTTDVMPIVRVNDRPIKSGVPGPITKRLVTEFRAYLDAACGAAHATS